MKSRTILCPRHVEMCATEFYHVNGEYPPVVRCLRDYDFNKQDLLASVSAELIKTYCIEAGVLKKRLEPHFKGYYQYYAEYFRGKSNIALRPVTNHMNNFIETNYHPNTVIRKVVKELTADYFQEVVGFSNVRKGSLVDRCLKVLSWDEFIYEPFSYKMDFEGRLIAPVFPRVHFSTNAMTSTKQVKMLKGFSKNTAVRGSSFFQLRKYLPMALKAMHKVLDTDKFVGTINIKWDPREVIKRINLNTGGGLSTMWSGKVDTNEANYVVHNTGKKAHLLESSVRYVHSFIIAVLRGLTPHFIDLEVVRQKQEWRKATIFLTEELEKLMEKMREFFCPSLNMIIYSDWMMQDRRKIETGNLIRIGMNFNHGGAYILAKYLHYDDDRFFWVDGDISQLDKSIQDWMLMLYIACGARYYPWEQYDERATKAMEYFVKTLMYKISHKMVLHLGTFWQFMRGVMHSGGKDTSHGDSWIMALLFYLYMMSVIEKHPHIADMVMNMLMLNIIIIIVYGDDHIWACLKILRPYINAQGWTDFLAKYCNMTLRDAKEYDTFLSSVDFSSGTYLTRGPVFLKRRFIASYIPGTALVLPYKDINETMINLFLKDQDVESSDYLLSCVGQLYDTMGTNELAYKYVKKFYNSICLYYRIDTPRVLLEQALNDENKRVKISRLMRRLHMNHDQILLDLPSLKKLQSWHVYDESKHKYGYDMPYEFEFA